MGYGKLKIILNLLLAADPSMTYLGQLLVLCGSFPFGQKLRLAGMLGESMHDLVIAMIFVSMVLGPAIVSTFHGADSQSGIEDE